MQAKSSSLEARRIKLEPGRYLGSTCAFIIRTFRPFFISTQQLWSPALALARKPNRPRFRPAGDGRSCLLCGARRLTRHVLYKRNVVALEEYLSCGARVSSERKRARGCTPSSRLVSAVSLVACLISTASSTTRFMNSSKPCGTRVSARATAGAGGGRVRESCPRCGWRAARTARFGRSRASAKA